jgi:hypothetical protein
MEPDNTARTPPASNELRVTTLKFVVIGCYSGCHHKG